MILEIDKMQINEDSFYVSMNSLVECHAVRSHSYLPYIAGRSIRTQNQIIHC